MLSICIPVFNQDVTHLVHVLHNQLDNLGVTAEIMVMDDGSDDDIREVNRSVQSLQLVRLIELPENIGRSKIRNLLAERATYGWLLYLDCDTLIINRDFIKKYLAYCQNGTVVCGGHVYSSEPPGSKYILHWKAGTKREVRALSFRQANPYHAFMTGNFLIKRDMFDTIKFHEDLEGYGHEDTLFAFELKQAGVAITHIDNPILHKGLEESDQFLQKTREGLRNLHHIYIKTKEDQTFAGMSRVLDMYRRISAMRLAGLLGFTFKICKRQFERNLHGNRPSLMCFDLYKLGMFHLVGKSTSCQDI